ncbi:MAG: aminotransferase class I/II-fold pyridoxal phosphate-dependent enzyme [Clostridia bacterium]|nr:aminotransferase class I/II-fold pyridoxal phosphate-dependent enzyme [Clostridia bacterium]
MNKIPLATPHMSKEGYEQQYVKEAFDTNWIAPLGENVNKFEEGIAQYVGIKSAAAMSSGSAALHLALKLAGVKRGDIVFCQALTFSATINPALYEGAVPVFIDSEEETWNMDPRALEKAFEKYPETKIVIAVNLYGNPAKLEEIKSICDKHNAVLIEDAAESLGSTYKGKQTGTFGEYNAFSFNGNKIITTSGGGMLVSDDEEKIAKARFWSTQSKENVPYYLHKEIGYNYRLSNICAGVGRGQLKVLDERIAKKTAIYEMYKEALEPTNELTMIPVPEDSKPNHWLSAAIINDDKITPEYIINYLKEKNIEARRVWNPMQLQPIFAENDFIKVAEEDVSKMLFERGICLPSDTKMTEEEQRYVIEEIKRAINNTK